MAAVTTTKQEPQLPSLTNDQRAMLSTVLLKGDISSLTPVQKWQYTEQLCLSLGLNPHTQPFLIMKKDGKESLYATKGCTEQLCDVKNISVDLIDDKIEDGLAITKAKAFGPDGRFSVARGVVSVENLKGEAKANALMKSETKACRRAVLRYCGLGMIDETEAETIQGAQIGIAITPPAEATAEQPKKQTASKPAKPAEPKSKDSPAGASSAAQSAGTSSPKPAETVATQPEPTSAGADASATESGDVIDAEVTSEERPGQESIDAILDAALSAGWDQDAANDKTCELLTTLGLDLENLFDVWTYEHVNAVIAFFQEPANQKA